jgi:hypothetical protein
LRRGIVVFLFEAGGAGRRAGEDVSHDTGRACGVN